MTSCVEKPDVMCLIIDMAIDILSFSAFLQLPTGIQKADVPTALLTRFQILLFSPFKPS